jgi:hypothetical protein
MPEGTRHARQLHSAKDVREPDGYANRFTCKIKGLPQATRKVLM